MQIKNINKKTKILPNFYIRKNWRKGVIEKASPSHWATTHNVLFAQKAQIVDNTRFHNTNTKS